MPKKITAWLSIGSTYTYLTALRIKDIQKQNNLVLHIKPISIRHIMKAMDNIPFPPSKKAKVEYMWRDIERRAELYGLPKPNLPAPYPLKEFDRANLVGILLNSQGMYLEYFEETYRVWFLEGVEAGSEENLRKCLSKMSLNFDEIVTRANEEEVLQQYEANTSEAQQLGIFGAPSFTIGKEIFWGDDRLEDAIRFSEGT
jgi:2-hydroxychromene-2-carboxylate isomerase